MAQQLLPQLKMKFLLGHNIEIVMQWERIKLFLGGDSTGADIFPGGRGITKFWASWWRLSTPKL